MMGNKIMKVINNNNSRLLHLHQRQRNVEERRIMQLIKICCRCTKMQWKQGIKVIIISVITSLGIQMGWVVETNNSNSKLLVQNK